MNTMNFEQFDSRYLKHLNPQQREAVLSLEGKILLLATPGSGKTTVLVTRLGYMICCKGIDPRSILTVTYTRAATQDMKRRFAQLFGEEAAAPAEFRTINGLSHAIVHHFWRTHGVAPYELLTDDGELNKLLRRLYQEVNDEYPEDGTIKEIRTAITYIKNMLLSDEEIERYESRVESLPELYRRYQQALRERRLMDYDDQMAYALNILRRSPQLLAHYRAQFRWLCVDEAQDTSKVQHEIIKLLAGEDGNLFMVGDEDQSIYGFRAAYPEALLHFEEDHPGARVLLMEENYRSTREITVLADRFIARNASRHEKTMRAVRGSGTPVRMISVKDRETQFAFLYEMAKRCDTETAILFRNNDSALPLIDAFERAGVPYNCRSFEDTFFNHRIVNDMQNILRFAAAPTDEALFMQLYYKFGAPISKASAQEAVRRGKRSGQPLFRELLQVPDVRGAAQDVALDLAEMLPQLPNDSAETALHRIWDGMHYNRYVRDKKLDAGKYFILCQLAKCVASPEPFWTSSPRFKRSWRSTGTARRTSSRSPRSTLQRGWSTNTSICWTRWTAYCLRLRSAMSKRRRTRSCMRRSGGCSTSQLRARRTSFICLAARKGASPRRPPRCCPARSGRKTTCFHPSQSPFSESIFPTANGGEARSGPSVRIAVSSASPTDGRRC